MFFLIFEDETALVKGNNDADVARGNGARILFVDDEASIADLMRERLVNLGYKVTIFTSSVEAWKALQNDPENIDLLITDMTMPEMTGVDLTREVLALKPNMPIILCSGFSETVNSANAKSFGISAYLKKPVDQQNLARAIRIALSGTKG